MAKKPLIKHLIPKGGKFILSRIKLSMQLYKKKPAEYGA
jgi:hypothetical protein